MGGTKITLMKRLKKLFKKLTLQRTTVLIIVFLILSGILVQRIFSLQIIHGQEYADNFTIQTTRTRTPVSYTHLDVYKRQPEHPGFG